MISSLSSSTLKQYNTAYKQWVKFCNNNKLDYLDTPVPLVLKFLTRHFDQGASYGTLNTYRSALSLILGERLRNNVHVSRFFKGIFRIRPVLPKYNSSWDPNLVLTYLGGLYPNESLSLYTLTRKLVTLLALSTGQRVQTLSLIDVRNITFNETGASITIDSIIKTTAPNRKNPKLVIPYFTTKQSICPAKTLHTYINMMNAFRSLPNTEKLILTSKKPNHNASAQSISRWIKGVLSDSGVDVTVYSAHSTRHAATSAARRAGVSLDLIKRTAGWSGGSICFAKFYNLPLADSEQDRAFAEAIFNS